MSKNNEILVSLTTLIRKEIKRYLRIWVQTLVPPAVTMSLYFVIFGSLIGPRIGTMDGLDYIQFMIPGLIMMSVITNSYANVVSSFYSVKFQKSIEELLISPMPNWAILTGFVMGGVSRGILIGCIVFCVSLFFYPTFDIANPALTVLQAAVLETGSRMQDDDPGHHSPSLSLRPAQPASENLSPLQQ